MFGAFYCRVLVHGLERTAEDYFTSFCFEHGAQGVFEELKYTQPDLTFNPTLVETPSINVNVFFPEQPSEDFFIKLNAEFPSVKAERFIEQSKDWLEEWKKGFEPFVFVDPFWICPSWRERPKQAGHVIMMDPGMAFGTGTHETTRLAAQLMVSHWPRFKSTPSVVDIGTGTGILSIIAEKLGATQIKGIDNDPEARRVARENAVKNASHHIQIPDKNIEEVQGQFDLVVANIIDGVLVDLRPQLLRVLKPGGTLILSGILADREKNFLTRFLLDQNLKIITRATAGEWVALVLEPGK